MACAGQMGMSLNLANALQSVSISWINTKAAPFGALIARKEYSTLDTLFFRALRQSMIVCIVGALFIYGPPAVYLNWAHIRFAQQLLEPNIAWNPAFGYHPQSHCLRRGTLS